MGRKSTIIRAALTAIILSAASIDTVQGADGTYEEAMEIRRLLTAKAFDPEQAPLAKSRSAAVAETIVLPVSRGFNQRGTALCWAYATFNALETIYLVRNPEGLDVELSRRAIQYYTMEDRYRRSIKGVMTYITEAGIALDALRLIQSNGIVAFDDHPDIDAPYGQANIGALIDSAADFTGKITALYEGLDLVYTAPPTVTHVPDNQSVGRFGPVHVEAEAGDLARVVLAGDVWQSYAPSETQVGFGQHPDPDARWENRSWYMPRHEFPGRIKLALEAGFPVTVTVRTHVILVYGAEYDGNGSPISYYIKDSYPDYYYRAEADELHGMFWEMTTVKL